MWPFRKKELETKPAREKPPVDIGERFVYLGVEMVCCRHWQWPYDGEVVVAEYVTSLGEIKNVTFCPADWMCLEAERMRHERVLTT